MKRTPSLMLLLLSVFACGANAVAQNSPSAFEQTQKLRSELSQLSDHEAEIKIRLTELDHDLKPENIERHFTGYGSLRPEELREARRKQLQLEKDRLLGQLSEIDQNRGRLTTEIQIAESQAFQQSASGKSKLGIMLDQVSPYMTATVLRLAALSFALIVVGVALFVAHKRRGSRT